MRAPLTAAVAMIGALALAGCGGSSAEPEASDSAVPLGPDRWMEDVYADATDVTLSQMVLPGTHDSGSSWLPCAVGRGGKCASTQAWASRNRTTNRSPPSISWARNPRTKRAGIPLVRNIKVKAVAKWVQYPARSSAKNALIASSPRGKRMSSR